MNKKNILPLLSILLLFVFACSDDNEVDKEKPIIDISFSGAFPTNCDTIYFGEPFVLRMKFSDNLELGAFSIDIHNNFDHHSHSTEVTDCHPDPDKDPVNPYVSINDYSIPESLKEYETNLTISIPESDGVELYDEGDYHFFIRLTDKEGWSAQKGLSIKMLHR
ncbi:DUF4625 domain-containing protein [Draconibacterium orientale]|uniref:DUF4625 domain-containing protein n=1 Tax=Draconibacterium orientale TaxID=1168034 RepID=UPI0029C0D3EC|nr:DUF4625 domain-containing protein [Draconibacterium orientale]